MCGVDVSLAIGDFFDARNFEALAFLNCLDKSRCLVKRFKCAGVEPAIPAAEEFDFELLAFEVFFVYIGDFVFSACRRREVFGDVNDLVVVKIEAGNGVARFGVFGLFFYADDAAFAVKFDDAISLGVGYGISEDEAAFGELSCSV